MAVAIEREVLAGRRAFATAQALLFGAPLRRLPAEVEVGWYDSRTHPEEGSFALLRDGAELDDLLGEVILVTVGYRQAFAYVLGIRAIPTDIALARNAFAHGLGRLSHESLPATVEVVG